MGLIETLRDHGLNIASLTPAEYQRPGDATIYILQVPALQAITTWSDLRSFVPQLGYWPVIGWDRFKQPPWQEEPTDEILAKAARIDGQRWFVELDMARTCVDEFGADREAEASSLPLTYRIPFHRFPHSALGEAPIALVPCTAPWKVPAFLRFSDDSQLPQDHVAVLKYWYDHWGAELVGWDGANAEMSVAYPPLRAEDACQLAVEQYQYCPDLVDQDLGSISALAHALLNSSVWRFWWD